MIQNYLNTSDQSENTKLTKLADNEFSERLYEEKWGGAKMKFKVDNDAYKIGIRIYSKFKLKHSLTQGTFGIFGFTYCLLPNGSLDKKARCTQK